MYVDRHISIFDLILLTRPSGYDWIGKSGYHIRGLEVPVIVTLLVGHIVSYPSYIVYSIIHYRILIYTNRNIPPWTVSTQHNKSFVNQNGCVGKWKETALIRFRPFGISLLMQISRTLLIKHDSSYNTEWLTCYMTHNKGYLTPQNLLWCPKAVGNVPWRSRFLVKQE